MRRPSLTTAWVTCSAAVGTVGGQAADDGTLAGEVFVSVGGWEPDAFDPDAPWSCRDPVDLDIELRPVA